MSFCKAKRFTGLRHSLGAAQDAANGFHNDNIICVWLPSCLFPTVRESRIYGGHPSGGRINGPRTIGFDFLTFCNGDFTDAGFALCLKNPETPGRPCISGAAFRFRS